jgi:methionine-rich copper-binding protein CopC
MEEPMHRRTTAVGALVAAALALTLPAGALAHAGIKSLSPQPGSSVSRTVATVRITFKARITDGQLTVRNAAGTKVSRGAGSVVAKHRAIRARLQSGLQAGRYKATAKWLDTDGHVETKTWSFRLR